MGGERQRERGRKTEEGGERERRRDIDQSLFDWPVAFIKVRLMITYCSLETFSEEHMNHIKLQSHMYLELTARIIIQRNIYKPT